MSTKNNKIPFNFYIASGIIAIALYLSYHLFHTPLFIKLQPYILILFFVAYSLIVFQKTQSLAIKKYLPILPIYMALFASVLFYGYLNGRGSQFWLYELVIQLSISGTSVFIGYGIAYIWFRIKEMKNTA